MIVYPPPAAKKWCASIYFLFFVFSFAAVTAVCFHFWRGAYGAKQFMFLRGARRQNRDDHLERFLHCTDRVWGERIGEGRRVCKKKRYACDHKSTGVCSMEVFFFFWGETAASAHWRFPSTQHPIFLFFFTYITVRTLHISILPYGEVPRTVNICGTAPFSTSPFPCCSTHIGVE